VRDTYPAEQSESEMDMDIDEGDLTRIMDKQNYLVIKGLGMLVKDQKYLGSSGEQSVLIKSSFIVNEY
jgi:hypothetical protein